jgi:hypothetical protein
MNVYTLKTLLLCRNDDGLMMALVVNDTLLVQRCKNITCEEFGNKKNKTTIDRFENGVNNIIIFSEFARCEQ